MATGSICRSSGRSRGSGLIPGPHPTLEVRFNATRLQWNLASPGGRPGLAALRHARRRRAVPAVRQVLQRCRAEDSRAANFNAHPDVVPARDSAASRRAWRNHRHRPAPPSPRAPDAPSAALEWSLDGTPASVRRRRPHRPAQPAVPSREGTPARHDQYRRPARNPPSVDGPSLRSVSCFLGRWSLTDLASIPVTSRGSLTDLLRIAAAAKQAHVLAMRPAGVRRYRLEHLFEEQPGRAHPAPALARRLARSPDPAHARSIREGSP